MRYPDWLHVALTTHAVDAVTNLDVDLAGEISALAATAGAVSEPRAVQALEVAIDAMDIDAVRPFWKAVLDYDDALARPDGTVVAIVDRLRVGPAFWFQQMEQPRPQRNRIHIDVTVSHDVAETRIAAALAAGGTLVSDRGGSGLLGPRRPRRQRGLRLYLAGPRLRRCQGARGRRHRVGVNGGAAPCERGQDCSVDIRVVLGASEAAPLVARLQIDATPVYEPAGIVDVQYLVCSAEPLDRTGAR